MSEPVDLSLRGNLALVRAVPYLSYPITKDGEAPIHISGSMTILYWLAMRVAVEREYSCFVTQKKLARESLMSDRQLRRCLAELRDAGLLRSKHRRNQSDEFNLNTEAIFSHRDTVKARLAEEKERGAEKGRDFPPPEPPHREAPKHTRERKPGEPQVEVAPDADAPIPVDEKPQPETTPPPSTPAKKTFTTSEAAETITRRIFSAAGKGEPSAAQLKDGVDALLVPKAPDGQALPPIFREGTNLHLLIKHARYMIRQSSQAHAVQPGLTDWGKYFQRRNPVVQFVQLYADNQQRITDEFERWQEMARAEARRNDPVYSVSARNKSVV